MRNKTNKKTNNKTNKKTNKKRLSRNKKYKSKKNKKSIKGGYEGTSTRVNSAKYIEIQLKGTPRDTFTGDIVILSNNMINDVKTALKIELKELFIRIALEKCLEELGNNGTPSENNIRITKIHYDTERYIYNVQFKVLCDSCIPSDYEFLRDELELATKSFEYNNSEYNFRVAF